jgi:hypothetical protein
VLRIVMIALSPDLISIIINVLIIAIDLIIARFVVKFIKALGQIHKEKLVHLRPFVRIC